VERVLVTGPDGFVGRHLRNELGHAFVPHERDVLDGSSLSAAVRETQPSAVVHLAALSSVAGSWSDVAEVWRVNVLGTVNVAEAVRSEAPGARLLFVSSGEVYGRPAHVPTVENAPVAPISPYGASKAAAELAVRQVAREVDVVVARSFLHIGPGQDERFAIASFAHQIATIEHGDAPPVLRVGNLEARRDLSDVRCIADAYLALLGSPDASGTYNVSTGRAERIGDVLDALLRLSEREIEIEEDPDRLRPADIPLLCGDPRRIAHDLGWRANRPLEQTLLDTLTFFRERLA